MPLIQKIIFVARFPLKRISTEHPNNTTGGKVFEASYKKFMIFGLPSPTPENRYPRSKLRLEIF